MDAIVLIFALFSIIIPFWIAHLWWWVWFWAAIAIVLALFELASYLVTGKTISQQFWAWRKNVGKPWEKWLIFGGMAIFWGYLLCHLFL